MGPLLAETMLELEATYVVHRYDLAADKHKLLSAIGPDIRAIATRGDYELGEDILCKLPNLKVIASSGAGYDGIDTNAATNHGVTITNTPGIVSECVADLAIALVLTTIRRTLVHDRFVRSGQWRLNKPSLTEKVWGERLGIIGLGGIGKAIARRALGFKMPIAYYGRSQQHSIDYQYFSDPVELARWARILVIAVPGGGSTTGLVSSEVIDALGPEGILINVSRGSVVDEPYLVDALVSQRLAGAGLDVFVDEPDVPEQLLGLDTVVLQPHIGSGSHYTRIAMGQLLLDNLEAFYKGKPLVSPIADIDLKTATR
jgi:hydroxypyruvate reductase